MTYDAYNGEMQYLHTPKVADALALAFTMSTVVPRAPLAMSKSVSAASPVGLLVQGFKQGSSGTSQVLLIYFMFHDSRLFHRKNPPWL